MGNEADEKNVLGFFTKTQDGSERDGRHDDVEAHCAQVLCGKADAMWQIYCCKTCDLNREIWIKMVK